MHSAQIIIPIYSFSGRKKFIVHHTTKIEKTVIMTLIFELSVWPRL